MGLDISVLAIRFLVWVEWGVLAYFVLVNAFYLLLLISASTDLRIHGLRVRGQARWKILGSRAAPRITVLAPAHNEATTVTDSVRALLGLNYPDLEIVVVNDGSSDETLSVLLDHFNLVPIHPIYRRQIQSEAVRGLFRSTRYPNLLIIDKENGGKADALNAGLNLATGELVCAIDADTLIESDALLRMVRPFLEERSVVAAGGTIRVANGSRVEAGRVVDARVSSRPLPGMQTVEYLRAFLFGRLGWNRLGGNLIISGAFGLFRRQSVIETGGYLHDTVGEDLELVMRLRRQGYETDGPHRIAFVPDPIAWTEVPARTRTLRRQRDRWHRGLADALWRHRRTFLNPRYGAMGMFVYPYFLFVELLAPVVELIGWIGLVIGIALGVLNYEFAILFFLVAYGLGAVLTLVTLLLEEISFARYTRMRDRARLVGWALLENLGYRQATVVWRLAGIWSFLRGSRAWGTMERRGFEPAKASARKG